MDGSSGMPLFPDNLYDAQDESGSGPDQGQRGHRSLSQALPPAIPGASGYGSNVPRRSSFDSAPGAPPSMRPLGMHHAGDLQGPQGDHFSSFPGAAGGFHQNPSFGQGRPPVYNSQAAALAQQQQLHAQQQQQQQHRFPANLSPEEAASYLHRAPSPAHHQQQQRFPVNLSPEEAAGYLYRAPSPAHQQQQQQRQHQQAVAAAQAQQQQQRQQLLLEHLQREQARAREQARNQRGAALMREFPQLAQAQQQLLAQAQARQGNAAAGQAAAVAALLQGQQGRQQQQLQQQQQQQQALQQQLHQQNPAALQQIYLNALRQLAVAQNIQAQQAQSNRGYGAASSAPQMSPQMLAHLQSQQSIAIAAAQALKQQQQQQHLQHLQQHHGGGAGAGPHANHALLAQQLAQIAQVQQQQQQQQQQGGGAQPLHGLDPAMLQALAKAQQQQQQQQQAPPGFPPHRGPSPVGAGPHHPGQRRQASPSLGILAAAVSSAPQSSNPPPGRSSSSGGLFEQSTQALIRPTPVRGSVPDPAEALPAALGHGDAFLPADLMSEPDFQPHQGPGQQQQHFAPVGSHLSRYTAPSSASASAPEIDLLGREEERPSLQGSLEHEEGDGEDKRDENQGDNGSAAARGSSGADPAQSSGTAEISPPSHHIMASGAFDAGSFAFFSGDASEGGLLGEELGGAEDEDGLLEGGLEGLYDDEDEEGDCFGTEEGEDALIGGVTQQLGAIALVPSPQQGSSSPQQPSSSCKQEVSIGALGLEKAPQQPVKGD